MALGSVADDGDFFAFELVEITVLLVKDFVFHNQIPPAEFLSVCLYLDF
jgi:hypothetical protein